jgi:hypothetical protein
VQRPFESDTPWLWFFVLRPGNVTVHVSWSNADHPSFDISPRLGLEPTASGLDGVHHNLVVLARACISGLGPERTRVSDGTADRDFETTSMSRSSRSPRTWQRLRRCEVRNVFAGQSSRGRVGPLETER